MLVVVERRHAKYERGVVSEFFWFTTENRGPVLEATLARNKTGTMESCLGQGGLADPAVAEKYRTVDA
jgi:hypothetical protein